MIEHEKRGDAFWITIDRPEKMNSLDLEDWEGISDGLEKAEEEARVAVITGVNDVFCAGDDIQVLDDLDDADDVEKLGEMLFDVLQGIEETGVPVIAAVNGLAYGGGFEIVAACDLAVAAQGASFALPETRIGAYPPYAVERVAEMAGRKRTMEMILTGESIDAETALDWGLVNRVVQKDEIDETVDEFVEAICMSPKRSTKIAKKYANQRISETGEKERMLGGFAHLFMSEESQEGVRAFVEDREPSYRK
ncbi:MAG: enoyl-CoA hydratase/isomerase family protein [Halobacteria archaeon]|nr:enoyl-CoA hydratase/isomerase family protein [Halobacteria archaeon]